MPNASAIPSEPGVVEFGVPSSLGAQSTGSQGPSPVFDDPYSTHHTNTSMFPWETVNGTEAQIPDDFNYVDSFTMNGVKWPAYNCGMLLHLTISTLL